MGTSAYACVAKQLLQPTVQDRSTKQKHAPFYELILLYQLLSVKQERMMDKGNDAIIRSGGSAMTDI